MHRAPRLIRGQPAEVERLRDDSLTNESRVAVDQQWQDVGAVGVSATVLFGAYAPFDNGIDELEVRRVERQGDVDLFAARSFAVERVAQVVLHVAAADVGFRVVVLEPGEDLAHVGLHDVDHHVEPATVRHPDDDLIDPQQRSSLDQHVQGGNHAFATFEREAFGPNVLGVEELFENLGIGELGEDADLLVVTQSDVVAARLHARLQPVTRLAVLEEGELDADGSRIGVFQAGDDLLKRLRRRPREVTTRKHGRRVDVLEPVSL